MIHNDIIKWNAFVSSEENAEKLSLAYSLYNLARDLEVLM